MLVVGCQNPKPTSNPEEADTVMKSDTLVTSDSLQFDFLNVNKELDGFKTLKFSNAINLGKITTKGLTLIDTLNWDNQLGSVPYLWFGSDSLTTEFNHGNFEGETFHLISRHKTSEYIWNIIGGFCGKNICTYHLLVQNKNNKILFFNGLGFVGFNYNPITVDYFSNNSLKYSLENCRTEDYEGAIAEVEKEEVTIRLDNKNEKINIGLRKSIWKKNKCN